MSGFEFLFVVRRRLPTTQVIAMSGAYTVDAIPEGVAADAFYRKGSGLGPLLKIVHAMTTSKRPLPTRNSSALVPVWLSRENRGHGKALVTIPCHECSRTFQHSTDALSPVVQEAECAHCSTPVRCAIVTQMGATVAQPKSLDIVQTIPASAMKRRQGFWLRDNAQSTIPQQRTGSTVSSS